MNSRSRIVAEVCCGMAMMLATCALQAEDDGPAPAETLPAKYHLAFKFRPNEILRYEVTNESEIATTAREDTEINRNLTKTKRHHRVAAVNDQTGEADLELSIDWVYMRAVWDKRDGTTPLPIEFQSDNPDKQPAKFKHILNTVGKPWATIRFKPTGNPVKVVTTAVQPTESKATVSDTGADGALEAYLIVLPGHPVAVGDTWREEFSVVMFDENRNLTKLTMQRKYKLADVKAGRATIELKTAILTPVLTPAVSAQVLLREVAGTIQFDIDRGVILSKNWTVENTVINAIGANSAMKGWSRYTEKLIVDDTESEKTAAAGTNPSTKK